MNVLVDTAAWSLAVRRTTTRQHPVAVELSQLINEGRAFIMGLIRQELLSGVRDITQFERLRSYLRAFRDLPLETDDYEEAATFSNRCRTRGIQGSAVDLLICAVASRRDLSILTTDNDFRAYSRILPIRLHAPNP